MRYITLFFMACLIAVIPFHVQAQPFHTIDRPWLLESEFNANDRLHALEGQTVVLRLEPGQRPGPGNRGRPSQHPGSFQSNHFRFLVEHERDFQFCIPEDEPHLKRLKIFEATRPNRPLIHSRPGSACEPVTLSPGPHLVEIQHNTRDLASEQIAFLRLPDATLLTGDPLTSSTATLSFMAWKGPNGKFVTVPGGEGDLVATATEVDEHTVWKIQYDGGKVDGSPTFKMSDGVDSPVKTQTNTNGVLCPPPLYLGPNRSGPPTSCGSKKITLFFNNAKATRFVLVGKNTAWSEDGLYGYDSGFSLSDSNQVVSEEISADYGIYWTVGYRGFTCTSGTCDASKLVLQTGEVALFAEEGYQGDAIVFSSNVPDFSIYADAASLGLGMGNDQAKSVRVGPNTLALLHTQPNFGGHVFGTGEDIPSLAGLAVGPAKLSSLQVEKLRNYVIDSNGCSGCDLTGIDLSGLNLSGADFSGANLTGADISGTSLFGANLDNAILAQASISGANFVDTSLRCTDLSDNDLTLASFSVENDAIAAVSDEPQAVILGIDPATGDRTILSGGAIGKGVALSEPKGLAASAEGLFLIDQNRLLKIQDGKRSLVSSSDRGTGLRFVLATDVTLASDGSIFVSDFGRQSIIGVDPETGNRTTVSGAQVGSGPGFAEIFSLAVDDQGIIYVSDLTAVRVIAVDPSTGNRSIVTDGSTGTGPALQGPAGIFVHTDGSILLVDTTIPAILQIDPETGNRTLISGSGTGGGPDFSVPTGLVVEPSGSILVTDLGLDPEPPSLFRVNPANGNREVVSSSDSGGGPDLAGPADVTLTGTASLTDRIATDFSCRLKLARSTFDIEDVPAEIWRYLDLTGATIFGAQGAALSSADNPLDLSGAILNAVNLSGSILDSANLGCATTSAGEPVCSSLQVTSLANASLKNASMSSALLQGASLSRANLDGADLSGARLLALSGGSPANLSGAFLRGVDLSDADLSGVIANNVNFYSINGAVADATNAVMTGAKFNSAYMAGADFSGATLQSTEWTQAVLVGANFTGADLSKNETAGEITDFGNAYLHGTVFANASVTDASFDGSYWDVNPSTTTLNIQLLNGNLEFVGYWNDPGVAACAQVGYPNSSYPSPSTPATDTSNTCPDGSLGNCDGTWENAPIPIGSATPPGAINPAFPGSCTETDLCWLFRSTSCVPQ